MLAACLAVGAIVPAAAQSAKGGDKVSIIMYGDQSPRMKGFAENELKVRALKEINVDLSIVYLPWSEYGGGKTDLMYASGEEFASMTDQSYLAKCVSKKLVLDLSDIAKGKIPNVQKNVGQFALETYQLGHRQYAIPVGYKPNASEFYPVLVRQDILEETGMKSLSTLADFETFVKKALKAHPDYRATGDRLDRALSYAWQKRNLEFLDNGANSIPLIVTDNSEKGSKVYSYWELPEIKSYLSITKRLYDEGIYDLSLVSNPEQALAAWNSGKALFMNGNAAKPLEELTKARKLDPSARFANYFLDRGGRPLIKSRTDSTAYSISASVRDPEAYLRFFDWWQSSQDIVDFLTYGVKGVDYKLKGESVDLVSTDELIPSWVLWNTNFLRFPDYAPADFVKSYRSWDEGASVSKAAGFIFDSSSVKNERAKIEGVLHQYMLPLSFGVYSYDKYPEALKALKAAGIDKYLAEYQRQFAAFMASGR
jgi:Bacterial extracellular solute-binding protein./Domain of unknown function (DUF3502).